MDRSINTAARLRSLLRGLSGAAICVMRQNPDNIYDMVENLHPAWPAQTPLGCADADILPPAIAADIARARALARANGATQRFECENRLDGERHLFQVDVMADSDDGAFAGTILVVSDITARREQDLAMHNLLREVSHRSKNLLAIVQSVAMQTAHHSDTIEDFLDRFRGRLYALASAQDLVTESDWRGSWLHSLVRGQIERVGPLDHKLFWLTGADPLLGPNAALHVGLAIHELAANAVIHGAWSGGEPGLVRIEAELVTKNGKPTALTLTWREPIRNHSTLASPRFGTMVLERIVPLSVGGSAEYHLGPDGVGYSLTVPADQFEV